MCGEGPHCLLGTARLRWCREPGARLLNHGQVQACPVPCPQARVITRQKSVPLGARAESVRKAGADFCKAQCTQVKH